MLFPGDRHAGILLQTAIRRALDLALKVALWTIEQMQDRTGYFYYRRYSPWLVNKTPTLHWGQATMFVRSPDSTRLSRNR